jgi:hypothetical protein
MHDKIPQMSLLAYDGSIVFNLMGALSINDRYAYPERVEIVDIKGLVPPWRIIDQKGATQGRHGHYLIWIHLPPRRCRAE